MQGGRDAFGDFDSHRSVVSSYFRGRDPFGSMLGPSSHGNPFGVLVRPNLFGHTGGVFEPTIFGPGRCPFDPGGNPFGLSPFRCTGTPGFLNHQPSHIPKSTGPMLMLDEPFVEAGERSNQLHNINDFNRVSGSSSSIQSQLQAHTITYGGASGPYYTCSTTRKSGSDGEVLEARDGVSNGKYTIGHGQDCMAFCIEVEDVISMGLTAVTSLLDKYNVDPPIKSAGLRLEVRLYWTRASPSKHS